METIEGNKLIAEFMGYKFAGDGKSKHWNITKPNRDDWYCASWEWEGYLQYFNDEFKYQENWDQLMPVVEKIEALGYMVDINKQRVLIWQLSGKNFNIPVIDTKIQTTQKAAIEFIQWYNTTLNK